MFDAGQVGQFFGKLVEDGKGIAGLKKGFEKFFNSTKEFGFDFYFEADIDDSKLTTKSKCPVFKYYSKWCETGCIEFVKGFASAFGNVRARRIAKQPESDQCIFEFKVMGYDG